MFDSQLSELHRRSLQDPDSRALRLKLYQELLRVGHAPSRSLALAANHGDVIAQQLWGAKPSKDILRSSADAEDMARLPIQSLDLRGCEWLTNDLLEPLGTQRSLRSLKLPLSSSLTRDLLEALKDCPLRSLSLRSLKPTSARHFEILSQWPLEQLVLGLDLHPDGLALHRLGQCPLRDFELSTRQDLRPSDLSFLAELPLKTLSLNVPNGNDALLTSLANTEVEELSLFRIRSLTDIGLKNLSGLPLRSLLLYYSNITGSGLRELQSQQLAELELSISSAFEAQHLAALRAWPLKSLKIQGGMSRAGCLQGFDFKGLNADSLESLRLANVNRLHDPELSFLKAYQVKHLSLQGLPPLSAKALKFISEQPLESLELLVLEAPKRAALVIPEGVKKLKLVNVQGLNNASLEAMRGSPLEELTLNTHELLRDRHLEWLESLPGTLKSLTIHDASALTDRSLAVLEGQALESLTLNHADHITDAGLESLSKLPLKRLEIIGGAEITDAGLRALSSLPLRELIFERCRHLTHKALGHLEALPLTHLKFYECYRVQDNRYKGMVIKYDED